MKRQSPHALVQAIALLFPLQIVPLQGLAQSLPEGFALQGGEATIATSGNELQINQTTPRAVLGWSSFNIGSASSVHFNHANQQGTTLNIVDGTSASLISGSLTADDSVYLINPHGLTITPGGSVNTGGAFVASTLSLNAAGFMNGSNSLTFSGAGGALLNDGTISAADVVLLGSRVANSGTILAPLGRVALGSGSQATLDFNGGGFLQVLAPANVAGTEALVTNSGEIVAAGGLVQLQAATAQAALREAVHMPGVVRAQSVSGAHGAIVFHGGEGGVVDVAGGTMDVSPESVGNNGGQIEVEAAAFRGGVDGFTVGPRGQFSLSVDDLSVEVNPNSLPDSTTLIVDGRVNSGFHRLLTAGTHVSIRARDRINWATGLMIGSPDIQAGANGQAGNLTLYAGNDIFMGGTFSTYNGDWTLSAGREILMYGNSQWATFVNDNGHLRLELRNEGVDTYGIHLPLSYAGSALTATIDPSIPNYNEIGIHVLDNIDVAGTLTLAGHLDAAPRVTNISTLKGREVNWTTETSGGRLTGDPLRFIEDGVVTRFGRGGRGSIEPGVDAVRLELGGSGTVSRQYGDDDPDQLAIGNQLFSVAAHNSVNPAGGISFDELLLPGSIAATGPGAQAPVGSYTLSLSTTADIALNPAAGGDEVRHGYWINLSQSNTQGASLNLAITPRPVTAAFFNPTYTYGSPHAALQLDGVINDDDVRPLGILNDATHELHAVAGGYAVGERVSAGSHTVGVSGITGPDAGNYSFDATAVGQGTLQIDRKLINYGILDTTVVYSEQLDVWSWLDVLENDEVSGDIELRDAQGALMDPATRLDVGEYQLRFFGLSGPAAGNYELAGSGNTEGTLRITPKPLTWRVDNISSVYGTLPELGFAALDGVLPNDEVLAPVSSVSPLLFNSPVGRYSLSVSELAGRSAPNYEIALNGHTYGTLDITPRNLTWATTGGSSEYGTLPSLNEMVVLTEVLEEDEVSATAGLFHGVTSIALHDRLDAGTYTVRAIELQGADAQNYQLDASSNQSAEWQITPRQLTWSVGNADIAYGSTTPPNSHTLHGLLDHDAVSGDLRLFVDGEIVEPNGPRLPVGSYDVVVHTLSGPDAANYALASTANTPGSLQIAPLQLTWNLNDGSVVYGNSLQTIGYTLNELLPGDRVEPVISALVNDFTTRPGAGNWRTYVTGLTGPEAGNYRLLSPWSGSAGSTGALTVTPRPLHYSAGLVDAVYGDEIAPIFEVSGLVEGDELPIMQYALTRGGQDFGTGYSDHFFSPNSGRLNVGDYTIEPRFIRGSNETMRNYTLAADYVTGQYFSAGRIFVQPRPVEYRIEISGAQLIDGHEHFRDYEAEYMTFGPDGNGASLNPLVSMEGVLFNDDVSINIRQPDVPVSRQGYYQTGTYAWRADGLSGADAANYTIGLSKPSRLIISPLSILIWGSSDAVTYGSATDAVVDLTVESPAYAVSFQEALDQGHLTFSPQAAGFQVEHEGRQYFAGQLPANASAGRYPIVQNPNVRLLEGPDSPNFAPQFMARGSLLVRPKELTVTATDLELTYGDIPTLDEIFTLEGVLPGDRVAFNNDISLVLDAAEGSRVFWRTGTLLDAGDYSLTSGTSLLTREEAANYTLPEVSARVLVNQKQLYLDMDSSVHYGEFDLHPSLKGVLETHEYMFFELDDVNYRLRGVDGELVASARHARGFSSQPDAGTYTLDVGFSGFSELQRVLHNYTLPPQYEIEVEPRPVRVSQGYLSQVYGSTHQAPFTFSYREPDDSLAVGVLSGDDVRPVFRVYASSARDPQADAERVFDEYLPVGRYDAFITGLDGSKAGNYVLTNPLETLTGEGDGTLQPFDYYYRSSFDISPKRLSFSEVTLPETTTYGEAIPLIGLQGVLPDDVITVVTQRNNTQFEAVLSNDVVWDAMGPFVGEYDYTLTASLGGTASGNYELAAPAQSSAQIVQRELFYTVDNVIGHYGNFAGCIDPSDPYLCTYKVDSNGVAQPDIWAPLQLGRVNFHNLIEGDDVDGNVILINPLDSTTLTLDDRPAPGAYLQAVDRLTGDQAHNYRIAATDNLPGVLNMQPKWVTWQTYSGFFSRETGIVTPFDERTDNSSPARGSLRVPNTIQGVDLDHLPDLTPVVQMFQSGVSPINGDPTDVRTWNRQRPGIYTSVVVDIEGEYAEYYRPLPPEFLPFGRVGFFNVTSLSDYEGEINSAILERQAQQVETSWAEWRRREMSGEGNLPPEFTSTGENSLPPEFNSTGEDTQSNEAADSPSSDNTSNLNIIPDGYADVLFEYGITGVTLEAGAGGEIEIDYQFGPGYARAGAGAEAEGRLQFNYQGIEGSGAVRAGLDASTGVEGGLGDLGRGSAELSAQANAFANASFAYTFENGRLVYRSETMTGVGSSATAGLGLEGNFGSANVKTTIYSPGTLGAGLSAGAGFDDGVLSFNLQLSLGLGLFGGSISFGGSINLLALADGLEEAGRWTARAIEEMGCQVGIGDCSSPTPAEIYQRNLAVGRDVNRVAASMGYGTSTSPAERYEYLKNNPEWVMSEIGGPDQERNRQFFNTYASIMDDLRQFQDTQERLKDEFEQALASGDTSAATTAMTEMTVWYSLDSLLHNLSEKAQSIGVTFHVVGGEILINGEN